MAYLTATTADGRTVILNDDGTWRYVAELQTSEIRAFRRTSWGMSRDEVRAAEENAPTQDDASVLVYAGSLGGMPCVFAFLFAEDRLVGGRYVFTVQHSNENDYLIDYQRLKDLLIKKYGGPSADQRYWQSDLFQDDPNQWGLAVSRGDLSIFTSWEDAESKITLGLHGDNFEVHLGIDYESRKLQAFAATIRDKKTLDEL